MTINTNNTTNGNNAPAASPPASAALAGGLSQSDFLKLMTTQLQAQDPTNPVDNSQFVSQMAQFSQLSATQDLLTSVNTLGSTVNGALQTSQVLGSSSLVNRQVLVPATTIDYSGEAVTGAVNVETAGNVSVNIVDATGKVVRTVNMGNQAGGLSQFTWDGKDDSGNALAEGTYTMAASSSGSTLDTYLAGKVTAVGYGGTDVGTYLQVAGVGGVPLSLVAQIL
ncbi:flagellar hook assembly protein FlgD [Rhodanobacter sp. Col0626]|uniref:flagellar hook assembly protein FlgD n=1 Tax=Rhodanobacter sp. Col0626 TaxID=3415679 RepID=UPI003CFBBCE2